MLEMSHTQPVCISSGQGHMYVHAQLYHCHHGRPVSVGERSSSENMFPHPPSDLCLLLYVMNNKEWYRPKGDSRAFSVSCCVL